MKKYGQSYSPRSHSVPNKFDLNATTSELLEVLRDDSHRDVNVRYSTRYVHTQVFGFSLIVEIFRNSQIVSVFLYEVERKRQM